MKEELIISYGDMKEWFEVKPESVCFVTKELDEEFDKWNETWRYCIDKKAFEKAIKIYQEQRK